MRGVVIFVGLLITGASLVLAGCGPALIGVAASSAGGGGGATPQAPLAVVDTPPVRQSAVTVVEWRFVQAQSRSVRFWFEYESECHGSGRVPAAQLGFGSGDPFAVGDEFVGATSHAGVAYRVEWAHEAMFGHSEVRAVTLRLRFRDDARTGDPVAQKELLSQQKLGARAAVLSDLVLSRPGGNEGAIVGTFRYADFGDDVPRFDVQYRVAPGETWQAASVPVDRTNRQVAPDCTVTYACTFQLDPIGLGMPFGVYPACGVQVRALEDSAASAWLEAALPTTIGNAPQIVEVSVPDPETNLSSFKEPRFQLPIRLRVLSTSQQDIRVRFHGEYDVNNGARQSLTFAREDESGTEREILLRPGESRIHYLIWNVVVDEGIGIRLEDALTSEVFIQAEVLAAGAPSPLVSPFAGSAPDETTLYTAPFVAHQIQLIDPAERLVSAGMARSPRTRDMFFSTLTPGYNGQTAEWIVDVDQAFAPIRIPGLQAHDIWRQSGETFGLLGLYPTDFAPGPDCLGRVARNENPYYHFQWPSSGNAGPVVSRVQFPNGRAEGQRSGAGTLELSVSVGGRRLPAFVTYGYNPLVPATNPPGDLAVFNLHGILYNDAVTPAWRGTTTDGNEQPDFRSRMPLQADGRPQPLQYRLVGGELDGNSATPEVFVGNPGIERATAQDPGWFDLFQVHSDPPNGDLRFVRLPRSALPLPPPGPGTNRIISEWLVCEWPNPGAPERVGLLLARTFNGDGTSRRTHTFHRLLQAPGGGFATATWLELPELEDSGTLAGKDLLHVAAIDLDGNLGGTREPELVALFESKAQTNPPRAARLDIRILVRTPAGWRWRTALLDATPDKPGADRFDRAQIVDVNGDDFPDVVVRANVGGGRDSGFYYFASALTGVAGGFGDVAQSAQTTPSRRPASGDFDGDGRGDLITAGRLYLGRSDGSFRLSSGGFGTTSSTAAYVVQRVFNTSDPAQQDLVIHDPSGPSTVQSFARVEGQVVPGVIRAIESGPLVVRDVAPFVPQAVFGPADTKELALVAGDGAGDNRLYRYSFDGSSFRGAAWAGFARAIVRDAVALRLGSLDPGEDATRNVRQQAVVVGLAASNEVGFASPDSGWQVQMIAVGGANERVQRIAVASVTEDAREDVLVFTSEGSSLSRLWVVPQDAARRLGTPKLYLQFDEWDANELRGLGFNPTSQSLAQGIVVFRRGVRVVVPVLEDGTARAAMIRSPLLSTQYVEGSEFGLQVTDLDRDGQIEIVGGELQGQASRLLKVDRAYRRN